MIIVVRGESEHGEVTTSGEKVNVERFIPTSIEIYDGNKGEEILSRVYPIGDK